MFYGKAIFFGIRFKKNCACVKCEPNPMSCMLDTLVKISRSPCIDPAMLYPVLPYVGNKLYNLLRTMYSLYSTLYNVY